MRVLFAGKEFRRLWDILAPAFHEYETDVAADDELPGKIRDAEVLIVRPMPVDDALLANAGKLRMIQQWGTGAEGMDLEACTRRGIYACNVPSRGTGNAESVAEMAIMHMLLLGRRYARSQEKLNEGKVFTPPGTALWKKKACIIGLGGLGHSIVERLVCLGMTVVGVNRTQKEEFWDWGLAEVYPLCDLEKAVAGCRFVILALPLNRETENIIGEPFFRSMERDAFFINVARGGVVVRESFERALENGWIAGAGLDVFWKEPPDATDPLLHHPSVTVTPHVGGVTDASLSGVLNFILQNIARLDRGEKPLSCLNERQLDR